MELAAENYLTHALRKINHLLVNLFEYSLDGLEVYVEDLSQYGDRTPAGIYRKSKVIVIDPTALKLDRFYSDYLKRYVYGNPIYHLILHEIAHYLVYTDQIDLSGYEDEELFCEVLAEQYNKIIHGEYQ